MQGLGFGGHIRGLDLMVVDIFGVKVLLLLM